MAPRYAKERALAVQGRCEAAQGTQNCRYQSKLQGREIRRRCEWRAASCKACSCSHSHQ